MRARGGRGAVSVRGGVVACVPWAPSALALVGGRLALSHHPAGHLSFAFLDTCADPSLKKVIPHPVPFDLYDPFGFSSKKTPEQKEKGLLIEINNGRLAMLGIMGFVAAGKVEGSVPALAGVIKPYAGEPMAYFSAPNTDLPFVKEMLAFGTPW